MLVEFALGILFILDQDVTIRHTRSSGNSYSLHFKDGRSFYPRSYPPFDEVVVYDGPWKSRARLVATLGSPAEVRAWLESL